MTGGVGGTDTLGYTISAVSSGGATWGLVADGDELLGTGDGTAQVLDVFGQIPAGDDASVGSYTDTVTVTLNF